MKNKKITESVEIENNAVINEEIDSRAVPYKPLGERVREFFKSRSFKHGGIATALTVFFLIAMVLLNVLSVMLVDRIPALSPDMTTNSLYTLSDTTNELLASLEGDITIDILATEDQCLNPSSTIDPYQMIPVAYELIKRYGQTSPKVTVNNIDIASNPGVVNNYPDYVSVLKQYYIVVSSDKRQCLTSFYNMIPYLETGTSSSDTVVSMLVETELDSQIKTACLDVIPEVSFVTLTDNSLGLDLMTELATNGYKVSSVSLVNEDIPETSDFVIICEPKRDLTEEELNKIEAFLDNGGQLGKNIFVFFDPSSPETPNLNLLLNEWGIDVTRDVIYETDPDYYVAENYQHYFFGQFKEETYSEGLELPGIASSLDVKLLFEKNTNYSTIPLISSTVGGVTLSNTETFEPSRDVDTSNMRERYVLVGSKKTLATDTSVSSTMMVCGSSFYNRVFTASDAYGNRKYLLNLFNDLAGLSQQTIDVTPKSISTVDFTISSSKATLITSVFQYALPAILLIAAFVVFLRRRHI